jgi:hypothetical protein
MSTCQVARQHLQDALQHGQGAATWASGATFARLHGKMLNDARQHEQTVVATGALAFWIKKGVFWSRKTPNSFWDPSKVKIRNPWLKPNILIGHMTQLEWLGKILVFGVLGQKRRFLVAKDTKEAEEMAYLMRSMRWDPRGAKLWLY